MKALVPGGLNFRRRADWMDAFFDFPILRDDVHLIRER
jgi:hypothetical protein